MDKVSESFQWSDMWFWEGAKAWFIGGDTNLLFENDSVSNSCKVIAKLPVERIHRSNPYCIKCGDKIFCMPCNGDKIYVYHIERKFFSEIYLNSCSGNRLIMPSFWKVDNTLYAFSGGLRSIIEIDIEKEIINHMYVITTEAEEFFSAIRVKEYIYINSRTANSIYEFNIETKNIKQYRIPVCNDGISTLCHDGKNFFVAEKQKDIFVWNKKDNSVQNITKMGENVKLHKLNVDYNTVKNAAVQAENIPFWIKSVVCGEYSFFFSPKTYCILMINRETLEASILDIEEEKTMDLSFNSLFSYKYHVLYVRESRFIGLFSLKRECYFEFDVVDNKVCQKEIICNKQNIESMISSIYIYDENSKYQRYLFERAINMGKYNILTYNIETCGKRIYSEL